MWTHLQTWDWSPKFATGLNMIIGFSSKSTWVTRLLFCQNDSSMRESFWQKDSLITHILFELQPIINYSPVANFGNQSLPTHLPPVMQCIDNTHIALAQVPSGENWLSTTMSFLVMTTMTFFVCLHICRWVCKRFWQEVAWE